MNICEKYICMYPVYMYIIRIKYIHKNLQNDDSENYLHDTTHYKSLSSSRKLVLNLNLYEEENGSLWDI